MYMGASACFPYTSVLLAGITVVVWFTSQCGCNKSENISLGILFFRAIQYKIVYSVGSRVMMYFEPFIEQLWCGIREGKSRQCRGCIIEI